MKLLPISLPAFLAHPTPHKHIYKHKHTQKYSQFAGQTLTHMYSLAWYWKRTNFANNLACWISELFFLRRNKFFFCLLACGKDILTYKNLFFWEYWLAHDSKLDEKRLLLLPAPPQKKLLVCGQNLLFLEEYTNDFRQNHCTKNEVFH